MGRLDEVTKSRISRVLDAAGTAQDRFTVKYEEENNPIVTITFSARPEYRFAIQTTGSVFATSECPGIHSDAAETFQRSDLELCINAITAWVERIIVRRRDDIIDEFGGFGG